MKYLTIILLIAVVACGCANAAKKQPMSFEDIDFDTVIKNERLMKNYMACMTNSGPCTQEGRELKSEYNGLFRVVVCYSYLFKCRWCSFRVYYVSLEIALATTFIM